MSEFTTAPDSKPYTILGAGPLTSSIWKSGDEVGGWQYRFNLFRMNPHNGHVSQLLRPDDVEHLVKLCQVLAATLADDGCIPPEQRKLLLNLAAGLDLISVQET